MDIDVEMDVVTEAVWVEDKLELEVSDAEYERDNELDRDRVVLEDREPVKEN